MKLLARVETEPRLRICLPPSLRSEKPGVLSQMGVISTARMHRMVLCIESRS